MKIRRVLALCLLLAMCCSLVIPASAASPADAMDATAKTLQTAGLGYGGTNGEWAVMGLARGGYSVPSDYYSKVVSYVKECGGVLHARKYSEYSRVVLALTAMGKDPTNVGSYNMLAPLEDFDQTVWQGMNGAIWALLALDAGSYPSSVRQDYVDYLVGLEISGGGWALMGDKADADITAMTISALAKYQDQKAVKAALDRAVSWLSKNQNADGTFSTLGTATCESTAQVVVALCEMGISVEDKRFTKNGNSVMDALMSYYSGGAFGHTSNNSADTLATEQGFYALVSANRVANGKSSLYQMSSGSVSTQPSAGSASFPDVAGHKNQTAIDTLVGMSIINGMGNGTFAPNKTMTRAQFCTIVVKALGLEPKANASFTDVKATDWYAGYVGTASSEGIVNGVGDNKFNPNGTISRQEAATMVARAAKTLGLNTTVDDAAELLSLYTDGGSVKSWAQDAVAYCCESGILNTGKTLLPAKDILRCEIAQMIYNMLDVAGKL